MELAVGPESQLHRQLLLARNSAVFLLDELRSEGAISLGSLDLVVVSSHRLVNIVGVQDVLGSLLEVGVSLSVGENFLSGDLVALEHLDVEDVVDFDVMSGESVVQERGREHHVIASIPELGVVLGVEHAQVSASDESESGDDEASEPEPHEHAGVVEGSLGNAHYHS